MSTVLPANLPPLSTSNAGVAAPSLVRCNVEVSKGIIVPGWVCDLDSYRQWAHSNEFPSSGWVSFLDGRIFVEPEMETFLTHNQVKQAFNLAIGVILLGKPLGRFVPDRMLFTNAVANVTTEPDGLYAHWETWQSGRLRLIPGKEADYTELEGTADMVLEIVSKSSEKKDNITLRSLYARAGIPEYWLVDARSERSSFEILRLSDNEYQSVPAEEGWVRSEVFGCCFQLIRELDPLGQPQFVVKVKA